MRYLCLFFVYLFFINSGTAGDKITFDDLYRVTKISDPQISPDGKIIALVVQTTNVDSLKTKTRIWLVNSNGTGLRQLTKSDQNETQPRWSPDGKILAFKSHDEDTDAEQIWLTTPDKNDLKKISSVATGVVDFAWSSDKAHIIFTSRVFADCPNDSCNLAKLRKSENNPIKARLYDHLLYRHYNRWYDGRVELLFQLNVPSGKHRKIIKIDNDRNNLLYHSFAVEPQNGLIGFSMSVDTNPAVYLNYDIFTLPNQGGEPYRLTLNRGHDTDPVFSPDGRILAYLQMARAGYESDQRDIILYNRENNQEQNITTTFDRSVGEYVWHPDSGIIYFSAVEHGYNKIWRVDTNKREIELVLGDAVYTNLRIDPNGEYLIITRSLSDRPYELYRFNLKDKKLTCLTHFNDKLIDRLEMKQARDFWFTGFNGDSVHGFLTLPPDFNPALKYPLVLLIHGGPQWCWLGDFNYYGWNTQLVAAQGYVVAQIDPHGSLGYGLKFQEYVSGNWGKGDYEDLMRGIDYLLETYPYIDSARLAALGRSYGGFMVNWICGHSDRFKCLVSVDGTFNHLSDYGTTEELWFPEWEFNGTPWSNPEEYIRSSPLTYAINFKTPTLVIHSQNDYRVDLSEGLQMFTALQRMSVPSQLLYFPDESHNIAQLKNLRYVYQKQFEWLARWLK